MNWKNRLTNYNFWISIFSAVLLILQALKIEFDIAYVNEIFTAVLGLLVVIGIISDPTRTTVKTTETNTKKESNNRSGEVENVLPTEEKTEIANISSENDFKVILDEITTDLNEKIKELEKFNIENALKTITKTEISKNSEINNEMQISNEGTSPAVAEIGNPYIDVIN